MGAFGFVKGVYDGGERGEGADDRGVIPVPLFEPLGDDQQVHVAEDAGHEECLRYELEEEVDVGLEVERVPACVTGAHL